MMGSGIIEIGELSAAIARELETYTEEIGEIATRDASKIADETVAELKEKSPHKTGDYAKSWKKSKKGKSYIVHSALPRPLEKGHAGPNGKGRSTPAHEHIAPVEEKYTKKYEDKVREDINDIR